LAVARYRDAVSAAPASAAAEHNLAGALGDAGRWREAETHIRQAFAKGGDAAESWLVLARALQMLKRYDEAEAAFKQALKRKRTLPDAHAELAQLRWMRSGDLKAAAADLDAAMSEALGDARLAL